MVMVLFVQQINVLLIMHTFISVTSISEVKASNLTPTTPQVPQISPRLSRQDSLRPNNQALPFIKQINEEVNNFSNEMNELCIH